MIHEIQAFASNRELSFSIPPADFLAQIRDADLVYVSAATTSPSISVRAPSMAQGSPSGDGVRTVGEYKRDYSCGVNATSRLRALAVSLPSGSSFFFDLDQINGADRAELLGAVFSGVVVCAESSWLLGYVVQAVAGVEPRLVLDLSVLVRTLFPALPYRLNEMAAQDGDGSEAAAGVLMSRDYHPCSLAAVSTALGIYEDLNDWPSGRGWTLGALSSPGHPQQVPGTVSHLEAIAARLATTRRVFEALSCSTDPETALANLAERDAGGEFFGVFERVPLELARMHARGLPVDREAIDKAEGDALAALPDLVADLLLLVPALEPLRSELSVPGGHATDGVRQILGGYAAAKGHPLPCDDRGLPKIGSDVLTLHGAAHLSGLAAWSALESTKRTARAAADLRIHARPSATGHRIHPLASVRAVTGRLSCTAPNAQGMDSDTKAAITARAGHVLVEADFGAIEIRIAAAQAVQAMAMARQVRRGEIPAPEGVRDALRTFGRDLSHMYRRAVKERMPMVRLLAAGHCPHDYTAIGLAESAFMLDLRGVDRLTYLKRTPRAEVRKAVGAKRKIAKVVNLGLLYMMKEGGLHTKGLLDGLDWTLYDARQARNMWFEQFPEIAFGSAFALAMSLDSEAVPMSLRNRYGAGFETRSVGLYRSTTLGGREVVAHDDRLINLRAQGTGATLILKALVDLPSYLKDTVLMAVHDSLLIEVPEERAAWYADELAKSMTASADAYLRPWGVPAVVETTVGKNWGAMS